MSFEYDLEQGRTESVSLLCSIVKGENVLPLVKSIKRRFGNFEECLGFRIKGCGCKTTVPCRHKCDCWFEHEYLEYIDNSGAPRVNFKLLKKICERITAGYCEHVGDGSVTRQPTIDTNGDIGNLESGPHDQGDHYTFTYFLHVASAVGNLPLVKYLCKNRPNKVEMRSSCGLVPLHLAIYKQHVGIVKYLKTRNVQDGHRSIFKRRVKPPLLHYSNSNIYTAVNNDSLMAVNISRRSTLTGKVEHVELNLYTLKSPSMALLKAIVPPKVSLILECLEFLELRQQRELVTLLLVNNDEDTAITLYKQISKNGISLETKIACVLTDSDRFFQQMLDAREGDCLMHDRRYGLADLALAVGSFKCFDRMKRHNSFCTKPKGDLYDDDSKFPHFHVVIVYTLKTSLYLGHDFVLRYLNKLKDKGVYIDRKDAEGLTPLQFVLKRRIAGVAHETVIVHESVRVKFVKVLLEFEANVDVIDGTGSTPLFNWITESVRNADYTKSTKKIVDILLYYNSSTFKNFNLPYYAHLSDLKHHSVTGRNIKNKTLDQSTENCPKQQSLEVTYKQSLFATLHELGFVLEKASAAQIDSELKQIWPVFYHEVYTQPRSLKSFCRLVVRRTHPGIKLIKLLEKIVIPSPVKRYILAEELINVL